MRTRNVVRGRRRRGHAVPARVLVRSHRDRREHQPMPGRLRVPRRLERARAVRGRIFLRAGRVCERGVHDCRLLLSRGQRDGADE